MARANVPHVISDDSALGGQLIGGSLRFDKASGDHFLSRTPSSASNQKTYTFSCWYKRSSITYSLANVLEQKNNGQNYAVMFFRDDDKLEFHGYTSTGGNQYTHRLVSSQVFRDTNAWYHIVVAVDTTQSTASNRVKIYVNGSQITDFDVIVNPSQNFNTFFNSTQLVTIGRGQAGSSQCYDGYMTEINFADGLQLEPSYFGYTDSQTGTWRPKKYKAPSVDNHFNWPLNNTHIDILNGTAFSENNGSPSFVSAGSNSFGLTNCLDIAGDGKYLSYAITPASQWTIDFYVKLDNQTGANSYIGGWNGTGGSNCCVGVNKDNAPNYYFVVWGGGGNLYQTNVTVSLNTWYHIRMTTNATNDLKLYVNGTLVATDTSSNENPVTPLTFGDMQSGRFNGQIAGVRYITRDLGAPPSGGLVSTNGVLPNVDSIIKYGANGFNLPLDGSNNITKDMSGNGNNFLSNAISGTVPIGKATGAFPILNTNTGATVAHSGLRSDPFANDGSGNGIVFASTLSESGIVASDVHHLIKGSGSAKSITISGATNNNAHHNFYGRSGSAYFDGNNDQLYVGQHADFDLGTGDFCFEGWWYAISHSSSGYYKRLWCLGNGITDSILIDINYNTNKYEFRYNNTTLILTSDVETPTNSWQHVAMVRQSGVYKMYVNGRLAASSSGSGGADLDYNRSNHRLTIGRVSTTNDSNSQASSWNGYIQDFRFYKGTCKYTEEFLCGAIDPSVLEDTPSGIAISRKLDTNTGGSVALHTTANVSPDIIIASNNDLYLDGDFTIEFWIYLNSVESDTHNPSIITFPDNSGIGQVYINSTYKFISLWWPSSDIVKTVDHGVQIGKWQYITITRSSNSCRIFVDGVLGGSGYTGSHATATSSQAFGNSYGGFRIGGYTQNTGNVDGHISNLRIIKGTALYTSSFTPPTEPLTNVSGTSLLCFQSATDVEDFTVDKNASTLNNKNWTRSGTFAWSIGADSSVNSKWRQFDGTIETGSAGAPNGNPGNVRFTFDSPITGITKCRIRANTHNDTYQYRRTYYNGANGTYSIQTGSNTTAWHDVTSNVGNTLNWVEWGSYGGADADRGPYGCNGIEINDVLLTDRFRDNDGHGDKSSASHFSPFDNDIIMEGPSQYATMNAKAHTGVTLSNGNLTNTGGNDIPSNMGVKTGKFYAEVRIDTAYGSPNLKHLGIFATGTLSFRAESGNSHTINQLDGVMIRSDAAGPYTYTGRGGVTSFTQVFNDSNQIFTLGDIVGFQLDMDNKFIKFYINGSLRTHYTFVLADTFDKMYFFGRNNGSGKTTWNFGQKPYEYTPPPGFLPLASHNLESSSILRPQRFFDVLTYSGTGSTQSITGLEFKPDLVWIKKRSDSAFHQWFDTVRGATKGLFSNSPNQEYQDSGNLQSFIEGGFTADGFNGTNASGGTYVAWCWKAGGDSNTFNVDGVGYATASAAGITDGSISLTGASINKTSGFSIFTYTGNGTSGATIGHGLDAVPSVAIFKSRNLGTLGTAGAHWTVFHQNLTNGMNGGGSARKVHLSLSQAEGTNSHGCVTASTSTTMTLTSGSGNDTDAHVNHTGGNYICYCWTEIPGFSKFGSYKGNGNANGPFVECGFRPSLVIYKRITNSDDWGMHDSARDPYNPVKRFLYPNLTNAEWSAGTQDYFEFYSNGFKLTQSSGMTNTDGDSYIFMAWAEQPEVTPFGSQSNAR